MSKNNCSGSRCFLCRTITHCKNDRYVTDIKARPNIIKRQHPTTLHCSTDVCAQAAASVAQSTKTTLRTAHPSVPVYNTAENSHVRPRGRYTRLHRLITSWPTHLSTSPLKPQSSLLSISRGLVYINIPGCTCLHELFEQVTAWVARFFFQQNGGRLSYTISRHLHWMVQWAGAQVTATTVWLTSNRQKEPLAELLTRLIRDHL